MPPSRLAKTACATSSSAPTDTKANTVTIMNGTGRIAENMNITSSNGCSIHKKPAKVITLCGSVRFRDAFEKAQHHLTPEGYIVLTPGLFPAPGDAPLSDDQISQLNDLHLRRIDMADEILVINVNGYIGSQTKKELEYARLRGKKIAYLEPAET